MERFICEKEKSGEKKKINLKITDWKTLKNVEYCNLKEHTFSHILKTETKRNFMNNEIVKVIAEF